MNLDKNDDIDRKYFLKYIKNKCKDFKNFIDDYIYFIIFKIDRYEYKNK